MTIRLIRSLATLALVASVGCSNSAQPTAADNAAASSTSQSTASAQTEGFDIVGTALSRSDLFSQLAGMLVDAGLVETLRGPGPFTVFAPVNTAFTKLPLATLHRVQDDPNTLKATLAYHVVAGKYWAANLQTGSLKTVAGVDLIISRVGNAVLVNGHQIAVADVAASNGVIHAMNDVLFAPAR